VREIGRLLLALYDQGWELRCYMRDPDGYLIEVGQYSQKTIDHFKGHGA